jgi:hypothetical protein
MSWCKSAADQGHNGGQGNWESSNWFISDEQKRKAAEMAAERAGDSD